MSSRPNFGLNELDFVMGTLIVGSILNFALMYLLAPTVGIQRGTSVLQQFITGDLLARMSAPTGHMFEKGAYNIFQRMSNFGYKAIQFGFMGFSAGIVGTSITNLLLEVRKKVDPTNIPNVEQPPLLPNSGCWALHMAFSSNIRYQLLNFLDQLLLPLVPSTVFRVYSTAVRCSNNIVGGISFATIARTLGVQKSGEAPATAPAVASTKGKKRNKDDKKKK